MVSNVLIDNSTLTAVQRLLGQIAVTSNNNVEGDFSAFDNFLCALLFYDNFFFLDDYKEDFRAGRISQFDYMRYIPKDVFPYEAIEEKSISNTEDIMLDMRAGRISDRTIREFLDIIGLHLTATWHMQSSDFFLSLRILSDEADTWDRRYKYTPLTSLIYHQLHGRNSAELDQPAAYLESSDGYIISHDSYCEERHKSGQHVVERQLLDFSNSLNWLARRSTFYLLLSSHFDASMCLHPIRHTFMNSLAQRVNLFGQSNVWRENFSHFFGNQVEEAVNAINASSESIELGQGMPSLASWAIGKTGSVSGAIKKVLELREAKNAQALRQHMASLDIARSSETKTEINKLNSAIEAEKARIASEHGIDMNATPAINVKAGIVPDFGVSISKSINLPDLGLVFGQPRHARALYRNIVSDIVAFPSLGRVRDMVVRGLRRDKSKSTPVFKIEEMRYWGRGSSWKKPM